MAHWHPDLTFIGLPILNNAVIPAINFEDAAVAMNEAGDSSSSQELTEESNHESEEDAGSPLLEEDLSLTTLGETAQRLYPLFTNFIVRIHEVNSRFFTIGMLRNFNISRQYVDFETGSLGPGLEMYIRPVHPAVIDGWIRNNKPVHVIQEFETVVGLGQEPDRGFYNNYGNATTLWSLVVTLLTTQSPASDVPELSEALTRWRAISNGHSQLNRRGDNGVNWSAEGIFHYCLPGGEEPDPDKPHVIAFVADQASPARCMFSTSALQTIMWLNGAASAQDFACQHNIIPVTVVCCTGFEFRILQGVVNYVHQTFELRHSEIINLHESRLAPWTVFMYMLGWLLGEPVGDTTAV